MQKQLTPVISASHYMPLALDGIGAFMAKLNSAIYIKVTKNSTSTIPNFVNTTWLKFSSFSILLLAFVVVGCSLFVHLCASNGARFYGNNS